MFGAIKISEDNYTIVECYPFRSKTYSIKDKLKSLGGAWNSKKKRWEGIKEKDLAAIPASKRIKIKIGKTCHHPPQDIFCFEHRIKDGKIRVSCNMCDSYGILVDVLENYGEA